MSHFYIMNAADMFDNKSATIDQAVEGWGNDQTILVAKRETGYDYNKGEIKYSKLFISGSGTGYFPEGEEFSPNHVYTQDTGLGHTNKRKRLIIENVISIDAEGNRTSMNDIGINEKRRTWCMK